MAVQAVLKKYDVLLIADEVICGFGRVGTPFGSHLYGMEPDLVLGEIEEALLAEIRHALAFTAEKETRRRSEEQVREQAALLDKARDAIIAADLGHRISYWNASAEKLYGWTEAEVLGEIYIIP